MSESQRSSLSSQISLELRRYILADKNRKRLTGVLITQSVVCMVLESFLVFGEILLMNPIVTSPLIQSHRMIDAVSLTYGLSIVRSVVSLIGDLYLPIYGVDGFLSANLFQFQLLMGAYLIEILFTIIGFLALIMALVQDYSVSHGVTRLHLALEWTMVCTSGSILLVRILGSLFLGYVYAQQRSSITWALYRRTGANLDTYQLVKERQRTWGLIKMVPLFIISSLLPWFLIRNFESNHQLGPKLGPLTLPSLPIDVTGSLVMLIALMLLLIFSILYELRSLAVSSLILWIFSLAYGVYMIYAEVDYFNSSSFGLLSSKLIRGLMVLYTTQVINLVLITVMLIHLTLSAVHFNSGLKNISLYYSSSVSSSTVRSSTPMDLSHSPRLESQIDVFYRYSTQISTDDDPNQLHPSSAENIHPSPSSSNDRVSLIEEESSAIRQPLLTNTTPTNHTNPTD